MKNIESDHLPLASGIFKYIAFCSDNESFAGDALKVKTWADQFPGAGWIYYLYALTEQSGIKMVSGDLAISNVRNGQWNPGQILVIQEMGSKLGASLIQKGANPFMLISFEAPLYAPFFYDKKESFISLFKYKLGFGLLKKQFAAPSSINDLPFGFPSYYLNDMRDFAAWSKRRDIVLVAANKYFSLHSLFQIPLSLKQALRMIKMGMVFLISSSYKKSLKSSLHNKRLELIEFFLSKGRLTIYGAGWDNLNNLPLGWRQKLVKLGISACYMGSCKDKRETLSLFKFALCCENIAAAGYITEKIIDCFVAGTVPIYLGANDIDSRFPSDSFINLKNFSSLDELRKYLDAIDESQARKMVDSGRKFLYSPSARLYSYEGFSSATMELINKC